MKDDEYDKIRASSIAIIAARIQREALHSAEILLRGAITQGVCYIDNFIMGRPFLKACDMESKEAIWPRILISDDVYRNIEPNLVKDLIRKDVDGRLFLDYLQLVIKHNNDP